MGAVLDEIWVDIASAIREKENSTGTIIPLSYADRIRGLNTVGGGCSYTLYMSPPRKALQ